MRILMFTILTTLMLVFPGTYLHAQTESPVVIETESSLDMENSDDTENSSETATDETTPEVRYSFGTILLAILIPSLFVIIAYLILKFFKF